jgi:hypothetical protein
VWTRAPRTAATSVRLSNTRGTDVTSGLPGILYTGADDVRRELRRDDLVGGGRIKPGPAAHRKDRCGLMTVRTLEWKRTDRGITDAKSRTGYD